MDNRASKEELDKIVKAADEEVAEIVPEEPKVEEPIVEEPKELEEPKLEEPKVPEPTEKSEEPKEPVDYKSRYTESGREALALHFKNKKIVETIEAAENMPEPTEDELRIYSRELGTDYDTLDDLTKNIMKDTLTNKKRFSKVIEITREAKEIDNWVRGVDEFIESTETIAKYPTLDERAEDFRRFCLKSERRNTPLDDLVGSFLFNVGGVPTKKSKGDMLLKGGGGVAPVAKSDKLDDEEAIALRNKDMREYARLVKAGKIDIEI